MKPDEKEEKAEQTDGGESTKSKEAPPVKQEPQPSTSSTIPNSPESALDSGKDALFEVS